MGSADDDLMADIVARLELGRTEPSSQTALFARADDILARHHPRRLEYWRGRVRHLQALAALDHDDTVGALQLLDEAEQDLAIAARVVDVPIEGSVASYAIMGDGEAAQAWARVSTDLASLHLGNRHPDDAVRMAEQAVRIWRASPACLEHVRATTLLAFAFAATRDRFSAMRAAAESASVADRLYDDKPSAALASERARAHHRLALFRAQELARLWRPATTTSEVAKSYRAALAGWSSFLSHAPNAVLEHVVDTMTSYITWAGGARVLLEERFVILDWLGQVPARKGELNAALRVFLKANPAIERTWNYELDD